MIGKKKKILIGTGFFLILFLFINVFSKLLRSHINLRSLNTNLYIKAADEVSQGRIQVNWQYLAAIDGVRYKNDFSKVNSSEVKQLGYKFVIKNSTSSKDELKSLDDVLNELTFNASEKRSVHNYLKDLKYIGSNNFNFKKSTKNIKFIDEITKQAVETYKDYGILPSVTIAQAILESGWGESKLTTQSNNLFGIKADSSWKGEKVLMTTSENYNDIIKDNFRVYRSKGESLKDYGEFIYKNRRYRQSGVFKACNYIEQTKAIERAGYSTKQNKKGEEIYGDLLIELIRQYNLQLIDNEVQNEQYKG